MVLVALMLVLLFGIAAIAVDGSLNYLDRRQLHAASDAAALSGAGAVSSGPATAQETAMIYAFQNLGVNWPATTPCTGDVSNPGPTPKSASVCTVTFGGYTVTVKNDYTPLNPVANPYSASASVAVDISHSKAQSGFAAALGTTAVPVASHSAATSQSGFHNFPFAVATRLLALNGNVDQVAYGAVLIAQCSKGGTGGFSVQSGQNGGLFATNASHLVLGSSIDSTSGTTYYQSAQAVVAADQSTKPTCSGGATNQNPLTTSTGAKDLVTFNSANPRYNFAFGFNSGPTGCSDPTVPSVAQYLTNCQLNSTGDGLWQDRPCWTANDVKTSTGTYDAKTDLIVPGTASACSNANSPASPGPREGSFPDSQFGGFPPFPDPISIVNTSDPSYSIPSGTAGMTTGSLAASGSIPFSSTRVYTGYGAGSNADLKFSPGWYVFDGSFKVDPKTFECMNSPVLSSPVPYSGCVFVFRNGASMDIHGGGNTLECSSSHGAHLGCAFRFSDNGAAKATMTLDQGADVYMRPVSYPQAGNLRSCGLTPLSVCMPLIYSLDTNDCIANSTPCAVDLKNSGSFKVGGTIYVPNGIYSSDSNASPASGQVVADTLLLQGGSVSSGSGVAYESNLVAPTPGAPFLFE